MADAPSLVICYKQLGDVLLLESALAKLASTTNAGVMLATRPEFAPMVGLMEAGVSISDQRFTRAARVISFEPRSRGCFKALTTWAAEKRLFVMSEEQLKPWHRFFFPSARFVANESEQYRARYFFDLIPGDAEFRPPKLKLPPAEWLPPEVSSGQYVLVHATSAWQRKCWPAQSWAQALDSLHALGMGPFVLTGGGAEWEAEFVNSVSAHTKAPLVNLSGKTNLRGYLAILANASLVLCIDGSAAHIAAAFQRPGVVMFGPTNPLHWYYPSSSVRLLDARNFADSRRPPVEVIPVQSLVDAVLDLLKHQNA